MTDMLVVGAHPDDAEFGMGASILKFIDQGAHLTICVLTRGESGTYGTPVEREAEMRHAAREAGADITILDLQDCCIFDTYENRMAVARVIRSVRPATIFAPYHSNNHGHRNGAAHPDHTAAGIITRAAARYARLSGMQDLPAEAWNAERLLYYMVPRSMSPSLAVDVTGYMEEWERICRLHSSQVALRHGKVIDHLRDYRRAWGMTAGVEYAEAFHSEDPVLFDLDLLG